VLGHYNPWHLTLRPRVKGELKFEVGTDTFSVSRNGQYLAEVDRETLEFLKQCDGQATVGRIIQSIYPHYMDKYANAGIDKAYSDALGICQNLERLGVLESRSVRKNLGA
jgi:hypothetical protein